MMVMALGSVVGVGPRPHVARTHAALHAASQKTPPLSCLARLEKSAPGRLPLPLAAARRADGETVAAQTEVTANTFSHVVLSQ